MGVSLPIRDIVSKSRNVFRAEGVRGLFRAGVRKGPEVLGLRSKTAEEKDILFIDGCSLPHPSRFRVSHQIEQMEAWGLTAGRVFYTDLTLDMLRLFRGFVFFRCPITPTVQEFIDRAHHFNKTCFFDIDDLVIDTKFTDPVPIVQAMSESEKRLYDDGVNRMKHTMSLCDYGITTTPVLQEAMQEHLKEVLVNRNTASDEMVRWSQTALDNQHKDPNCLVIGFFSGSMTHNANFDLVASDLVRIMQTHQHVQLLVAGKYTLPEALTGFAQRIVGRPFVDWRKMPAEMARCDIIIAPLEDNLFNQAKSENRWIEAALVKVPTVASDVGAFHDSIVNGVTGILVSDDGWFDALNSLIQDPKKRESLGQNAYHEVQSRHVTVSSGRRLVEFVSERLSRHVGFVLPSLDISGGVNVVLKHADILRERGVDVTIVDDVSRKQAKKIRNMSNNDYCVVKRESTKVTSHFDLMVASLWTTVRFVLRYPSVTRRAYFVQSLERDFYTPGNIERIRANSTYCHSQMQYLTMSPWCKKWLWEDFGQEAKYAPNGLDLELYPIRERTFGTGRVKILVEGDSKDYFKNVDEAFAIVDRLDPEHYEIGYLSYRSGPKKTYRVDHFYSKIPPSEVGEIYAAHDILIKSSILESFSFPPLEMMATGGFAVIALTDGNAEYVRDGENCMSYTSGNIDEAVEKIHRIVDDPALRETLRARGLETAQSYSWVLQEPLVAALYD